MNRGWLWAIAALASFQLSDVTLRIASVDTHFAIGTILQSTPLLLAAAFAALHGRRRGDRPAAGRKFWPHAVTYGTLQFFVGNMLFMIALQLGGLSIASPSVQSQAIWAVIIGGLFLREKVTRVSVAGIILFFLGLVLISWFKSQGADLPEHWMWAFVFGIAGGLAWAAASSIQSRQLRSGVPLSYMLFVGAFAGIALLNVLVLAYYGAGIWRELDGASALKLLAAGCFTALAIMSVSKALQRLDISKLIPVISLSIVLNTLIGGMVFDEYVNAGSVVGMIVTFAGVVVVQDLRMQSFTRS